MDSSKLGRRRPTIIAFEGQNRAQGGWRLHFGNSANIILSKSEEFDENNPHELGNEQNQAGGHPRIGGSTWTSPSDHHSAQSRFKGQARRSRLL